MSTDLKDEFKGNLGLFVAATVFIFLTQMARFDDRSDSPPDQTRATEPEPDSSRFRFSDKMRLIQKAAELVLPALIEHIGKVNECSQTHEPKWEPKWTQFDIQNSFLLLQERKWPLTTKNFSDAFSHSTGSEDETLNQITSPSSDLSPRVIAVRDAIVDCFSDLLKDSSPISDCFHEDVLPPIKNRRGSPM